MKLEKMHPHDIRRPGDGPRLGGKAGGKAAHVRHLIPFIAQLARKHAAGPEVPGDDARRSRFRAEALSALEEYYVVLTNGATRLTANELVQLRSCVARVILCWLALRRDAARRAGPGEKIATARWKLFPKAHMFWHIPHQSARFGRLNPRISWTYADEDMVGQFEALSAAIETANEIAEYPVAVDAVTIDHRVAVGADDDLLVFRQDRAGWKLVGDTAGKPVTGDCAGNKSGELISSRNPYIL